MTPSRCSLALLALGACLTQGGYPDEVAAAPPRIETRTLQPGARPDASAAVCVAWLLGAPETQQTPASAPTYLVAMRDRLQTRARAVLERSGDPHWPAGSFAIHDGKVLHRGGEARDPAAWQRALRAGPKLERARAACGGLAPPGDVLRGGTAASVGRLRIRALPAEARHLMALPDGGHLLGMQLVERWSDATGRTPSCLGSLEGATITHRLFVHTDPDGEALRVVGIAEWPELSAHATGAGPGAPNSGAVAQRDVPQQPHVGPYGWLAFARVGVRHSGHPARTTEALKGPHLGAGSDAPGPSEARPTWQLWHFTPDGAPTALLLDGTLAATDREAAAARERRPSESSLPPWRAEAPQPVVPAVDLRPLELGRWLGLVALARVDEDGALRSAAIGAFLLDEATGARRVDVPLPRSDAEGRWLCDVDGQGADAALSCSFEAPNLPGARGFLPRRLPPLPAPGR